VEPAPPRVRGLPLLGSALELFRDPIRFLLAQHRRYGPVFRLGALHLDYVVLCGREANEFVHDRGKECFSSKKFWRPFLREIEAPNSIVASDGEDHAALRRLLAPQMSKRAAEEGIAELVRISRESFQRYDPGAVIRFVPAAQRLVSRQVGYLLTGRVPTAEEHTAILAYLNAVSVNLSLRRLPRAVLVFGGRRLRQAKRTTFAVADDVMAQADRTGGDGSRFVADIRTAAAALPHLFTPGDVRAAGILPFFAGVDTVGQTLAFALWEVLRRPDLLARLRGEVDPIFEKDGLGREALRSMGCLQGAVLETLRLHPTAFGVSRTATRDFSFAGRRVKRGQDILVFTTACHFLPEYFPAPETFDVDRHRAPRNEQLDPNVFAPFGRGPHACLGASFSLVQLATTLATLLHHYDFELVEPERDYETVLSPTPSLGDAFTVRFAGVRRSPPGSG
jgi:cytochrome P450